MKDGATISARSSSESLDIGENQDVGKAGNVIIQAYDEIQLENGSSITVETSQADAGDIQVTAGSLVDIRDQSAITTSVAGGKGDGGNIGIESQFVVLDGASEIIAQAKEGSGGDIGIRITNDGAFFQSPDSTVDASSEFGVSGSVQIEAPDTDITSGLANLPEAFLDVANLLSDRCGARTAEQASSFVVIGHGGIAPAPDNFLTSSYATAQFADWSDAQRSASHQKDPAPKPYTISALAPISLNLGCNL
ncbi:MAG: hypothetical protein R3F37_03480 [Candidatus Competibacteraceae bacterium]